MVPKLSLVTSIVIAGFKPESFITIEALNIVPNFFNYDRRVNYRKFDKKFPRRGW